MMKLTMGKSYHALLCLSISVLWRFLGSPSRAILPAIIFILALVITIMNVSMTALKTVIEGEVHLDP